MFNMLFYFFIAMFGIFMFLSLIYFFKNDVKSAIFEVKNDQYREASNTLMYHSSSKIYESLQRDKDIDDKDDGSQKASFLGSTESLREAKKRAAEEQARLKNKKDRLTSRISSLEFSDETPKENENNQNATSYLKITDSNDEETVYLFDENEKTSLLNETPSSRYSDNDRTAPLQDSEKLLDSDETIPLDNSDKTVPLDTSDDNKTVPLDFFDDDETDLLPSRED